MGGLSNSPQHIFETPNSGANNRINKTGLLTSVATATVLTGAGAFDTNTAYAAQNNIDTPKYVQKINRGTRQALREMTQEQKIQAGTTMIQEWLSEFTAGTKTVDDIILSLLNAGYTLDEASQSAVGAGLTTVTEKMLMDFVKGSTAGNEMSNAKLQEFLDSQTTGNDYNYTQVLLNAYKSGYKVEKLIQVIGEQTIESNTTPPITIKINDVMVWLDYEQSKTPPSNFFDLIKMVKDAGFDLDKFYNLSSFAGFEKDISQNFVTDETGKRYFIGDLGSEIAEKLGDLSNTTVLENIIREYTNKGFDYTEIGKAIRTVEIYKGITDNQIKSYTDSIDLKSPTISGVNIVVDNVNKTATIRFNSTEGGYYYYLISNNIPTRDQVLNGNSQTLRQGTNSLLLTDLPVGVGQKLYIVGVDPKGNKGTVVNAGEVKIEADKNPDAYNLANLTGLELGATFTTAENTLAGVNTSVTASVSNGAVLIVNGENRGGTTTLNLGDKWKIQGTTSSSYSTSKTFLVLIGEGDKSTVTFTATTKAQSTTPDTPPPPTPDTEPTAFDVPNMTNQALSTAVTTNAVTVAGINQSVTASTTVGTIVKNGTDTGSASTTVVSGDTVAVKLTTSGSYSTAVNGTITIGTGATNTDNFSVTTLDIPAPNGVIISGSTLSWNSVSGANKYQVCRDAGTTCQEVAGGTTTYGLLAGHIGKTLTVQSSYNNGSTRSLESNSVTYNPDITPPTTTESVPSLSDTTATVRVNSNEAGEIRYIIQLASAGAPTLDAVKTTGTSKVMVVGNNDINLSGLTPGEHYKMYVVSKDSDGNWQASLKEVTIDPPIASFSITTGDYLNAAEATVATVGANYEVDLTVNDNGVGADGWYFSTSSSTPSSGVFSANTKVNIPTATADGNVTAYGWYINGGVITAIGSDTVNLDRSGPSLDADTLNLNGIGNGSGTGTIDFNEEISEIVSIEFVDGFDDTTPIGGTINVTTTLPSTTNGLLDVSYNLAGASRTSGDDVKVKVTCKDKAGNQTTVLSAAYTL